MRASCKHLVVGDVIDDGTIIAINPDDPIYRRRFTVKRPDGSTFEAFYTSIMLLHLRAGPTFTRCVALNIDSTTELSADTHAII